MIRDYNAYSFCGSAYLFVVGFQENYLLTALAFPLIAEASPLRLHLLTIPEEYRYLDTVKHCCVQDDGRLRALITESPDGLLESDGPRSILASFDMLSDWEDANALITRRISIAAPHIDASHGFLSLPHNAQLPVQTLRAQVDSEKFWRCRKWSIVDAQGNVLLERKYFRA